LWLETTLVLCTGYGYRLNLRQIGATQQLFKDNNIKGIQLIYKAAK